MARFWFVSAPLYSHTDWGGFLPTAQALQQLGHEVIWVSEESLKAAVERKALPFAAIAESGWLWPPPPQPDVTQIPPQEAVNLRYKRALDTWLSEDIVGQATDELISLAGAIGKPDLIVTDPFLSASALAAEVLNTPMVVCGWPAQHSLEETALFPVQRNLGSDSRQRIDRLCERFDVTASNFSGGSTPSILSSHLHISYFTLNWYAAEMDTLLMQNIYVGGKPKHGHGNSPTWLNEIPLDTPLALITLGSIFTGDLGFFSWAAQAAAAAGLLPVVVIGWNPIEQEDKKTLIRALPPNTRLLNWVPFEDILPRTRLMIHHGGMGTTHAALIHGVPQIVVPHAADQRIQGRRVAQAKVGLNLTAHDVRQGMLKEGAQALIADANVKHNAIQFAQEMYALGGPERAANEILRILG